MKDLCSPGPRTEYYECQCHSPDHTFSWTWWHDDNDSLNMNIHLSNGTFFKRLKDGVKYIFGYRCLYGHFDETLINRDTAKRMVVMLNKFIKGKRTSD